MSNDLPDKLAALEFSGSTLNLISRGLLTHPRQQLRDTTLKHHLRFVSQQRLRLRYVRHAMPNITLPILADNLRLQINTQPISQQTAHFAYRRRPARADVDRLVITAI